MKTITGRKIIAKVTKTLKTLTKKRYILKVKHIQFMGACKTGIKEFRKAYPLGIDIDKVNVQEAMDGVTPDAYLIRQGIYLVRNNVRMIDPALQGMYQVLDVLNASCTWDEYPAANLRSLYRYIRNAAETYRNTLTIPALKAWMDAFGKKGASK